jgi:hypothetical protein
MWKVIIVAAGLLLLLFAAGKAVQNWINAPGIDFNKTYDKTML